MLGAKLCALLNERIPNLVSNIPLHLDIGLTAKLYEVLGNRRGAIVAIDPLSGGILGLREHPNL